MSHSTEFGNVAIAVELTEIIKFFNLHEFKYTFSGFVTDPVHASDLKLSSYVETLIYCMYYATVPISGTKQ